jgi:hypothetical protein
VEVNVPFSRLRSIHCESQNYADDECQLIYILNVNSEVSVRYQLVNDDLTYEDIDDRTTANLIAMFYTYNISTNSIIFDNAELVLFESHENTTFEGKLLYYPDKLVY